MYLVYAKEGKKEAIVISFAQAWRLSMYEGSHSSFCTTHYCPRRYHYKYASVAYRSPPTCVTILLRTVEGLVSSRGEGRLRTVPCVRFYTEVGTALYRPLWLGLCRGERLYCSLCYGFVEQGGGGSLPSPVFGFTKQGGDGSLPSSVFDFIHHRGCLLYTSPSPRD